MQIKTTRLGEVTVAEIGGDIDGKSAPAAQAELLPLAGPNCKLIFDMATVEYMSSAGLRMLLSVRRQINNGGRLVLVNLPEQIQDTMAITGFLDFFTIYPNLAEGLAAFELEVEEVRL